MPAQFDGERARHARDGGLRRVVVHLPTDRVCRRSGSDIHYGAAAALRDHAARDRLAHEEHGLFIDGLVAVPDFGGERVPRIPAAQCGVVDEDVDAAEGCGRRRDQRLDIRAVRDVARTGDGLAARRDDLGGNRIAAVLPEVRDCDRGARISEPQRNGAADAASRAGNTATRPVRSNNSVVFCTVTPRWLRRPWYLIWTGVKIGMTFK